MLYRPFISFFCLFFILVVSATAQETSLKPISKKCTQCHGNKYYQVHNDFTDLNERKFMNPYYIVDTLSYLQGVHQSFGCTDCHSPEYETYPHVATLKMEPQYSCLDCHGGDELFAQFHFDEIAEEVENSIHSEAFGMGFKCEMCHDPHTYKLIARNQKYSIKEIVGRDNAMCLKCHNNVDFYQLLSDNKNPEIIATHKWLPNQKLHFQNVRCIECHTPTGDTLMVSHNIVSKELAVRQCAQCHSSTSILRDKLYNYKAKETRSELGFYNSVIMNEAYVIGANRNKYLNNISLIIFGLTLFGMLIHIIFRIIKRN